MKLKGLNWKKEGWFVTKNGIHWCSVDKYGDVNNCTNEGVSYYFDADEYLIKFTHY